MLSETRPQSDRYLECERTEAPLGAKTVNGLGMQTAGSAKYITGTDARSLTAAARYTRSTSHAHTRAVLDTTERGSKEH
ncbi:hypothetical protein EVAR_29497_1 [Eumeta japonica]|uniref:Uncharacterized protein n=1 Tax=Eumeta variegata TaxID=151549 RepID=A0A4C1WID9_EUMVA|nr:hypothetical protein EVAR_29497_1 [Eumeta japonica]